MNLALKMFTTDNEFFDERGKPKYMDDKYFKALHFKFIHERERMRRKKGTCIIPGCKSKSVLSHTIPESSVLKQIAHLKEVRYLKYNPNLGAYECASINIGKASAFPGFCIEHERLFSGFENNGDFEHPSFAIQNLRVIFRYLFEARNHLQLFERTFSAYKKELDDYHNEKLTLVNAERKDKIKIISVEDEITRHMQDRIHALQYLVAQISNEHLNPFIATMNGDEDSTSVISLYLDCELPICLAGKSEFMGDNGKYAVHLSIFPNRGRTFCCFSLPKINNDNFKKILDKYKNDLEFLAFVESWMIYGTDFWYINPLEWESYSDEKKEKILIAIRNTERFPSEELDFTIFDALRKKLVTPKTSIQNSEQPVKQENL